MKSPKLVLASIALCMSLAAFSQTDTTKRDTTTHKSDTTAKKGTPNLTGSDASLQQAQGTTSQQPQATNGQQTQATNGQQTQATNGQQTQATNGQQTSSTASTSQAGTSQESTPKPNFGRYYIPVLGSYQSSQSTGDNKSITITGDESNPGKIWIEGLTSSKFYALLKAVPGTYKVPAQKQDDNSIQEGTVMYDENSKQINICLGCGYQDANPSEALTSSQTTTDATAANSSKATSGKNATAKNKTKTVVSFTGTKSAQGTASIAQ